MTLSDQILDECQVAGRQQVLGVDFTEDQIIELISDIVRVNLHPNSIGARLAIAAYIKAHTEQDELNEAIQNAKYAYYTLEAMNHA